MHNHRIMFSKSHENRTVCLFVFNLCCTTTVQSMIVDLVIDALAWTAVFRITSALCAARYYGCRAFRESVYVPWELSALGSAAVYGIGIFYGENNVSWEGTKRKLVSPTLIKFSDTVPQLRSSQLHSRAETFCFLVLHLGYLETWDGLGDHWASRFQLPSHDGQGIYLTAKDLLVQAG